MKNPRVILLSFDRLSRRCLGCYGHEWVETPNLDRLAANSVVFDQHFATVQSAATSESGDSLELSGALLEGLRKRGIATHVLTEEPALTDDDAIDLEDVPLTKLIAQADPVLAELAREVSTPWLLWLKSAGIVWPCVATEEFAALYADELNADDSESDESLDEEFHEEDEYREEFVEESEANSDDGGRELDPLRLAEVAYAASVTQLDHLVGRLLASIERLFGVNPPLLIVVGLSGESLGESESLPLTHVDSSVDGVDDLRDEIVHTPLLIAGASANDVGSRRQELVCVGDVTATVMDWLGADEKWAEPSVSLLPLLRNESVEWRDRLVLLDGEGNAALRTNDAYLVGRDAVRRSRDVADNEATDTGEGRRAFGGDAEHDVECQLFLKPEDVWEINDVAAQQPERVAELRRELHGRLREFDEETIAQRFRGR